MQTRIHNKISSVAIVFGLISFMSASCSQPYGIAVVPPTSSETNNGPGGPNGEPPPPTLINVTDNFNPTSQAPSTYTVIPRVRLMFVVDNSGSTASYQNLFTQGFSNFANKYFVPGVDLSMAVVTSDTYLAGTPGLDPKAYGPNNASCYSRLFPGIHDGKRPNIADGIANAFQPDSCLLTDAARAQIMANGDRSLSPILSTIPADPNTPVNQAYVQQLIAKFEQNVLPQADGDSSERGFQSFHTFLRDNEERPNCSANPVTDPTCFYPHYDIGNTVKPQYNGVVFVSDEHEQTSGSNLGVVGGPNLDHSSSAIAALNDANMISTSLTLAQQMKKRLNQFFLSLQTNANPTNPNYSIFSIVNINCNASLDTKCGIQAKSGKRDSNERWGPEYNELIDILKGNPANANNGRPTQPADTVNTAAANSQLYDINAASYDALFNFIGNTVVNSTTTVMVTSFALTHVVYNPGQLVAKLLISNGSVITISPNFITVLNGNHLTINAQALQAIPQGMTAQLQVSYQASQ